MGGPTVMFTLKTYLRGIFFLLALMVSTEGLQAQGDWISYTFKGDQLMATINPGQAGDRLDTLLALVGSSVVQLEKTQAGPNSTPNAEGWKLVKLNRNRIEFTKPLKDLKGNTPLKDCIVELDHQGKGVVSKDLDFAYGANEFKFPSVTAKGNKVSFRLPAYFKAKKVFLAGSFNDWSLSAHPMRSTSRGWETEIELEPGKHFYKFVVDGKWRLDKENAHVEDDGYGNMNSVYFHPNHIFRLEGFKDAREVFVTGSFNDWEEKKLAMTQTAKGWEFPILLERGTHTYKFIVDGAWMADPANEVKSPDGFEGHNSVLNLGKGTRFELPGYGGAKEVYLIGDFNGWEEEVLWMEREGEVWTTSYVLKPGNHAYKFVVDGKHILDPRNPHVMGKYRKQTSVLTVEPNHTFKLEGFEKAKEVFLSGDFNGWSEKGYSMKKSKDGWVMDVHLDPGKVQYKYIVDGGWMVDPKNPLWEENRFGTKNSILWVK